MEATFWLPICVVINDHSRRWLRYIIANNNSMEEWDEVSMLADAIGLTQQIFKPPPEESKFISNVPVSRLRPRKLTYSDLRPHQKAQSARKVRERYQSAKEPSGMPKA